MEHSTMESNSEIIIYKNPEGNIRIDVTIEGETVWLTIDQMSELFQKSRSTINEHIINIYDERELEMESSMRKIGISDFSTKPTNFYNLDVIISVGYRVKSLQGTQFRIWATQRLREHIVKGFTLNDERFKTGSSMNYFRELLDRIREIRLSERVFYQQVKDIYATSIDYDPSSKMTQKFFQEVQNKFLWAISGKTAAELIYYRANAQNPQMGLTSTKEPNKLRKTDVEIAKNYLAEEEVAALKLLVEQYLAFAESQALAHKPMYMKDWIDRLGMILTMNERNILNHAGKITHELALRKADHEYEKFKEQQKQIEKADSLKELEEDIRRVKRLPKSKG
jgi:hypothetical protein